MEVLREKDTGSKKKKNLRNENNIERVFIDNGGNRKKKDRKQLSNSASANHNS